MWRPLVNPLKNHRVSSFAADNLAAFGLLQRDHDFRSYEDLAARYDLRPSLWVQPATNWGAGAVELVEIPTPNEFHDNVVAYWVPKQKPAPGQEFHWACTLSTFLTGPERAPLEAVLATRISPEQDKNPPRFVIDFTGDTLGLPRYQCGGAGQSPNLPRRGPEPGGADRTTLRAAGASSSTSAAN